MLERREQKLREEVTFYDGHPRQFKDEEAMYEVDIPTDTEELGTGQYDTEGLSDMFIGPVSQEDFVRLQRNFYQKCCEHKEFSQHVWKVMHMKFPITFTSAF